ncbi:hypothetical protein ILUMI_19770, partial [Ignelater luminosus]
MGKRCESKKCANSIDKRKCHAITEEQREEFFTKFWSDIEWNMQMDVLIHFSVRRMVGLKLGKQFGIVSDNICNPTKRNPINSKNRLTIKAFFESLPKLPSHYCRPSSRKVYLENGFTSYSDVYELYRKETSEELICSRPVVVNEMKLENIDIFQPRKDQTYHTYHNQKNRARQERCQDKDGALSGETCAYTMDVQAVQLVLSLQAGIIYFKQNDGCCAQNRNQLLANALLHYCITNNETVIKKYLIKGSSRMERDSVHSTIENEKKRKEIHAPSNYVQLIQQARKRRTKEP